MITTYVGPPLNQTVRRFVDEVQNYADVFVERSATDEFQLIIGEKYPPAPHHEWALW